MFIFLLSIFFSRKVELRKLNANNYIIITIEAEGDQSILYNNETISEIFSPLPSIIKINNDDNTYEGIYNHRAKK